MSAEHTPKFRVSKRYGSIFGMKIFCLLLALLGVKPAWADEIFSLALPECRAGIERRSTEPGVLRVRTDCDLSMDSLSKLLREGLPIFFAENSPPVNAVGLGRLMNYPQWSRALARAAADSKAWDRRRGRPAKPPRHENQVVTALLNQSAYLGDLRAVFLRYSLKACVAGVEKVLVFRAEDIFRNDLPDSLKLAAGDLLPGDAQVWLTLQPADEEIRGLSLP